MGLILLLLLALAIGVIYLSHNEVSLPRDSKVTLAAYSNLELPVTEGLGDTLIFNAAGRYTYLYSPHRMQSLWVAYRLTASDIGRGAGRSSNFTRDQTLADRRYPVVLNSHYRGSGYDKGHLLPSADRSGSKAENAATFCLSNVAPQLPALNRGTWKRLEEELRRKASSFDTLYIVSGGVVAPVKRRVTSEIAIPELFYKVILFNAGGEFSAVGYVMPNSSAVESDPAHYRVSVDSVERLTGFDFFHNLPDQIETLVEKM